MARELSQEAVLDFLWGAGGRAPNTALLRHFQPFLRDPALTEQQRRERREYFKSLVNSLATVHPAAAPGASKDIVLRRRYRDLLDEELPPPPPEERCATGRQAASITVQVPAAASHLVIPTPAEEIQGADPQQTNPNSNPAAAPPPAGPAPSQSLLPAQGPNRPQAPDSSPPARLPVFRSIRCQLALLEVQGIPPSLPDDCGQQPRTMPSKKSLRNVPSRGLLVPLGQREHAWLVAMSAGCWARVRELFLEEPELALQRDFMSGFTVLHWLAKHGDGPGLQELAAAAQHAGLALDVDARSGCGYTPLHLAAIHGHQLVIKVLVLQLGCQVQVRDSSGRRPWEYLGSSTSGEIWQLLEAPRGTIMFPTQPLARSVSSASKVSLSAGRTALPACLRPQHGRGADSHGTGSESD
ncbi:PREDICTED: ankyrin repeat domain-containing protein SOWAHB [Haliaeetus leucocephalus]|uniref:ankyrin repeat domain-containing protein SOWAHB n=1 Tax=Haliaeetus leucocephalus TaxID=52644 RepID=UPI00053CD956|nr:PREDICTED: ankyrin repeat domain-containing protein SOWAHB [Haliaeetus leucocephalus]